MIFENPSKAQVCQAISEMSTTLGDLENTFTQKMQAFLAERPQLATHVTGLKEDITGLIKVLSEKLVTSSDVEATIEDEVSSRKIGYFGESTCDLLRPQFEYY